jgi:hypothetical protein
MVSFPVMPAGIKSENNNSLLLEKALELRGDSTVLNKIMAKFKVKSIRL